MYTQHETAIAYNCYIVMQIIPEEQIQSKFFFPVEHINVYKPMVRKQMRTESHDRGREKVAT